MGVEALLVNVLDLKKQSRLSRVPPAGALVAGGRLCHAVPFVF
jgi:hypothetical protein